MIAARLGGFAAALRFEDLPGEVVDAAKLRVLDTLGAALAGVHLGNHRPVLELLESAGGPCRLWGEARTGTPREAALVNSFATHSTYLEDGSRFTGGHPSSVVIPAAIAQGEARHASGAELIAAVIAGYEVFLRLGRAIYPQTVVRGFQSTAVLGAVSAAGACVNLKRLSAQAGGDALAIAATLGVGLKEALKSSASQPIQVARSCEGGLLAAAMAQMGSAGAAEVFEKGFLPAFGGACDEAAITRDLGVRFDIRETYLKRHAGCRGNHAPVDAAIELFARERMELKGVRRIRAFVDTVTRAAAIEPPRDGEQAQFSIGFSIAVALLLGDASIFRYTSERLVDPAVRGLMDRIEIRVDPALDAGYPGKRASRVEVELEDGRVLSHSVDNARGEPEWPLDAADVAAKFLTLATPRLGGPAQALREMVASLEALADVAALTSLLAPPGRP